MCEWKFRYLVVMSYSFTSLAKQINSLIREKGEGAVYYYISIDEQHAMKKGDKVELLVNYGKHYEGVRERKGYGLVNYDEGLGGDQDDKARLQRNFEERKEIENEIIDLSFMQVSYILFSLSLRMTTKALGAGRVFDRQCIPTYEGINGPTSHRIAAHHSSKEIALACRAL